MVQSVIGVAGARPRCSNAKWIARQLCQGKGKKWKYCGPDRTMRPAATRKPRSMCGWTSWGGHIKLCFHANTNADITMLVRSCVTTLQTPAGRDGRAQGYFFRKKLQSIVIQRVLVSDLRALPRIPPGDWGRLKTP